jgi:hypothetical protein
MIILAWNGGTPSDIFEARVFKQVLSIFITAAVLKLGQGIWSWLHPFLILSAHFSMHTIDCFCPGSSVEGFLVSGTL